MKREKAIRLTQITKITQGIKQTARPTKPVKLAKFTRHKQPVLYAEIIC